MREGGAAGLGVAVWLRSLRQGVVVVVVLTEVAGAGGEGVGCVDGRVEVGGAV